MKIKQSSLLITLIISVLTFTANAQIIRISLYSQEGLTLGDITKKEINSSSAGYVDFNSSSGLEINYYPNNKLGIGLRWTGSFLGRDTESYETDLKEALSISDEQYDITQSLGFWSYGGDLGVSYLVDLSEKFQFEPYFYLGFKMLKSPMSSVIYNQNDVTYQYQSKAQLFFGLSYSPGIKLNWNVKKRAGLYLSLEYDGNAFLEEDERSMIYSHNTLEITDTKKNYTINSLNIGLGLSFRFGKGLKE